MYLKYSCVKGIILPNKHFYFNTLISVSTHVSDLSLFVLYNRAPLPPRRLCAATPLLFSLKMQKVVCGLFTLRVNCSDSRLPPSRRIIYVLVSAAQ